MRLPLLFIMLSMTCLGRPLIYTKSEFKGNEDGKTSDINQIRIGYDKPLNNIVPWIHAGIGVQSPKGENLLSGDHFKVFAIGAKFTPIKPLSVKAKLESFVYSADENDWKFEVKSKYYLF